MKQKTYENFESGAILFLGGFILCALCYGFLLYLTQPEFIITKEECREGPEMGWWWSLNLEPPINLTIKKSELVILNRELLSYRFLERAREEQNFTKGYTSCEISHDFEIIKESDEEVVYSDKMRARNCVKWIEICEQVEVDKIILYETEIKEICLGEICEEFDTEIYKEDLTMEWLDENCECLGNSKCSIEGKAWSCCSEEYKCGEYIVKVI